MPMLRVEDLSLSLGGREVLNGLSFVVNEGEVYGLVGMNGAGKSTTINVVCDVLRPDRGSVSIDGRSSTQIPRELLGIASQEVAVYQSLTVRQNLEFFGALYGLSRKDRRQKVEACLESVGLLDRADSLVAELSGGMQRRLHLAAALIHDAPLLILDEPTVGLDLEIRRRMWDLILGLRARGAAILLTTHHLEEAEVLCSRLGILDGGRIALEGTLSELRLTIDAAEIAVVGSDNLEAVRARCAELGFTYRDGHEAIDLWLREKTDIKGIAARLGDMPLTSIRLRPVGLADIFAETVRSLG